MAGTVFKRRDKCERCNTDITIDTKGWRKVCDNSLFVLFGIAAF